MYPPDIPLRVTLARHFFCICGLPPPNREVVPPDAAASDAWTERVGCPARCSSCRSSIAAPSIELPQCVLVFKPFDFA
jgi:hypothetical protein